MTDFRPGLVGSRGQQEKANESVEIRVIIPGQLIQ